MKKITVLGSANADFKSQVLTFPKPGETVMATNYCFEHGGKGANQAVACARLGAPTSFISCIGADLLGTKMLEGWKLDKIDVSGVNIIDGVDTGSAQICVDSSGENFIVINSGANRFLSEIHVEKSLKLLANSHYLLLQLETPEEASIAAAMRMKAGGGVVVLNPAPAKHVSELLLSSVDIITPNETEAFFLTGIKVLDASSAKKAAEHFHNMGIHSVIITLGSRGAFVSVEGQQSELVPGYKVSAVDTVAAGDTFNGAFLVALAENKTIAEAVRFAHAAAAIAVSRPGAQDSVPTRDEVEDFIHKELV